MPKDDRFPDNHARYMHRQALDTIVSACFSKWETSEVLRKLEAAKIANAKLNTVASLSSHSILRNVQDGPTLRAEFKVRFKKKDDE
jgi:itaconate CoA-transferase